MHRRSRLFTALGLIIPLTLTGCTPDPAPSPGQTSSANPSSTADAAETLRAGAPSVQPIVATTTLVADTDAAGCEFAVFSVTATQASTVLDWGIQCGDRKPLGVASLISVVGPEANLPALEIDGDTYKATRYEKSGSVYGYATIVSRTSAESNARPLSTTYAPLPEGTRSVQITSPVFAEPITAAVTSPNLHPGGNTDIPIVARSTFQGTSPRGDTPLLASIHGVRRIPGATAVYYSLAPANPDEKLGFFLDYGDTAYDTRWTALGSSGHFVNAFALFDYSQGLALGQFGRNGFHEYSKLAPGVRATWAQEASPDPLVFVAYLPEVPTSTSKIDLLLGGRLILQDLPVTDGAMTPTSTDEFPALGTGWPTLQTELLASMPTEESTNVTSPLIPVVTDGTITHAGNTLELNTEVLFHYNEATLTPAADAIITQAATDITNAGTSGAITITGHTDNTGTDTYNLDLSRRRAQTVADALRPLLPATLTMTVDGKGETEPTADNNTDAGKAANRRVVITLPK